MRSGVDALGPRGQAAALLSAAGQSLVAAGHSPGCISAFCCFPPWLFSLEGPPPRPIGARSLSLGTECGYTPPSSRRNPHPKHLAEHPSCPVLGLHWPQGEGGVLGTTDFVASRLGCDQHRFSMKSAGMCPQRLSTQGVRACPVSGGPKSPPGDIVHPPPQPHLTPRGWTRHRGGNRGPTPGQDPPSVMSHPGCCPLNVAQSLSRLGGSRARPSVSAGEWAFGPPPGSCPEDPGLPGSWRHAGCELPSKQEVPF